MYRSFDREMWRRHVFDQSEDADEESTNQRKSRRMYRKLFRPMRKRTTRTLNTEQFHNPCKEHSKDEYDREQSAEGVRSDVKRYTKRSKTEHVRIYEHDQSEEPDVQRIHNSKHNQLKIREHERKSDQERSVVRKISVQRKTTDDGEQHIPGEQKISVRRDLGEKVSNDGPNRKISNKTKPREEHFVEHTRDKQIEKNIKNVCQNIRKSSELLNRSNESIEKTSEQSFDNPVNREPVHHESEHVQVVHEQIIQKSEQNQTVRDSKKPSKEQNIFESSKRTSKTTRRVSSKKLPQEHNRKNSEQKFDKNTNRKKGERVSSIRCISPNSSSAILNRTSSTEQKRSERTTKHANDKQTNKTKSTEHKITTPSEQMNSERISNRTIDSERNIDSEHVLGGHIEHKERLRQQRSRTKKCEHSREQFDSRILDSDLEINEIELVPVSSIEQRLNSEEQSHEQINSGTFGSYLHIEESEHVRVDNIEKQRSSEKQYSNKKFASVPDFDDKLVRVGSAEQKRRSKEQKIKTKKENIGEHSRTEQFNSEHSNREQFNSELELETEEVPFEVAEHVPLDVPFYVYSYNSGLTAEPTLSDIYLPSDFSFDDMTEESQNELLLALEEDSSHLLSELLHLTSSEDLILSQSIDRLPRKKLSRVYSTCYRLARRARPRRITSRNNANLVYRDVINATKENHNQSLFTNENVGRGVQRLVDKEKKGLVQREEEFLNYDGQPTVKKMTYGLSIGLLIYSLYKINSI
jgi:hypothetical protein